MYHKFPKMVDRIPELSSGDVQIVHRTVGIEEIRTIQLRDMMSGAGAWYNIGTIPGTYLNMTINGEIVMSDTWMEQRTNQEIVKKANGNVLIAGLGIGMILTALCDKESVDSITVVEFNQTVIDLVSPYIDPKIQIVQGDIFKWATAEKFDTIYFDIWANISADNYEETKTLHKRYRKNFNYKNPDRYMGSWMRDEFKRLKRIGY